MNQIKKFKFIILIDLVHIVLSCFVKIVDFQGGGDSVSYLTYFLGNVDQKSEIGIRLKENDVQNLPQNFKSFSSFYFDVDQDEN